MRRLDHDWAIRNSESEWMSGRFHSERAEQAEKARQKA
jgi:hypothetical protein